MSFSDTALQMVVLAIPILIGYIAHKLGFMGGDFDKKLSGLVVNVTLPAMIVASVCGRDLPAAGDIAQLLAFSLLGYVIATAVAILVPRLIGAERQALGVYSFIVAYGNVGLIGFPVLSAVLGGDAVLYAAIANIPWNLFVFSVGMLLISGMPEGGPGEVAKSCAKQLLSPVLIASVIVLMLVLLGVNDLGILGDGLSTCGAFTTPAALLISGSSLANYSAREMVSNWRAYVAVAFRLVGVPAVLWLVMRGVITNQFVLGIVVLGQAMPVATNGILYCLMYGKDAKPMTQGTFISIVASILTIPLIAMLVMA